MDKLEKYIRDNRAWFDDRNPGTEVWHKINDQLDNDGTPQVRIGTYLWRAAAVLLFIAVVWLLVDRNNNLDNIAQIPVNSEDNQIRFNDVEAFYMKEIETKQQLILQFVSDTPEIDRDLLGEIDQLDSTYQVLKSTVEKGYSEKVLDAMVLNLQMRIDILNQQLEVLEKIKNLKENETISI
jgi:hypothetical protein